MGDTATEPATAHWEEWPLGHEARTWFDGAEVDLPLHDWGRTVSSFMGCGFCVRIPAGAADDAPLKFARVLAERTAQTFGTQLDNAAWDAAATMGRPFEIQGGWEYGLQHQLGAPWTRLASGGRTHVGARIATAIRLPWTYGSDSPTASLPMISRLEADQAERHLAGQKASVGMWFNHREELCSSTAGPILIQVGKRSWVYPDRAAGIVSNWTFFEIATRLGALPQAIDVPLLGSASTVCTLSEFGNVTLLEAIDGERTTLDPDQVRNVMEVRREILPSLA